MLHLLVHIQVAANQFITGRWFTALELSCMGPVTWSELPTPLSLLGGGTDIWNSLCKQAITFCFYL